jgi:23S rRNA G2445 N2-methylase RlmL
LEARVADSGYTPRERDLPRVLALIAHEDPEVTRGAARALVAAGEPALTLALAAIPGSTRPLRARLVALVGRLAERAGPGGPAVRMLVECLRDPEPETRRKAITALGRLGDSRFEASLLAAWDAATLPEERRALARALGNVGGAATLERLERLERSSPGPATDPELERLCGEARLKVTRRGLRGTASEIDASARLEEGARVLLHVRAGLEELLLDELGPGSAARIVGRGRVQLETREPLQTLFRARTFLHVGFPLPPEPAEGDGTDAVVRALTSEGAHRIFTAYTRGPIRYRIEWSGAGRRRAATFVVAGRVLALRADLHNDGTIAPWEAVVSERGEGARRRLFVELWPRALPDPRFTYRVRTLPAASHPTVSAALARVAGARPDDVVWDPFVGSGTELVERALLGPYAALHGTDVSADALAAARANLAAARVERARLELGDVRRAAPPEGLTLVISNPPFGRRVSTKEDVTPLLEAVLERSARAMGEGGRVAWISPAGDTTAGIARRLGLAVKLRRPVDMGGIPAELQLLVVGQRSSAPRRGGAGAARPRGETPGLPARRRPRRAR